MGKEWKIQVDPIDEDDVRCPVCGEEQHSDGPMFHVSKPDGPPPLVARPGGARPFAEPVYRCRQGHHFRVLTLAFACPCDEDGRHLHPVEPVGAQSGAAPAGRSGPGAGGRERAGQS